jgi:lipid A 3-O-deacylase
VLLAGGLWLAGQVSGVGQDCSQSQLSPEAPGLWQAGVGEGFNRGASELEVSAGAGLGMTVFGSEQHHHWALSALQFGWVLSEVVAKDHWYRGNWELAGEVFGGGQFHPDPGYVAWGTLLLRYDLATGHRWVPFVDVGAGPTVTDIRDGDLSTTFEFNLQAGLGTHIFLRDDLALTLQCRLMHLSNAGMVLPNLGLNSTTLLLGLTWFY